MPGTLRVRWVPYPASRPPSGKNHGSPLRRASNTKCPTASQSPYEEHPAGVRGRDPGLFRGRETESRSKKSLLCRSLSLAFLVDPWLDRPSIRRIEAGQDIPPSQAGIRASGFPPLLLTATTGPEREGPFGDLHSQHSEPGTVRSGTMPSPRKRKRGTGRFPHPSSWDLPQNR